MERSQSSLPLPKDFTKIEQTRSKLFTEHLNVDMKEYNGYKGYK